MTTSAAARGTQLRQAQPGDACHRERNLGSSSVNAGTRDLVLDEKQMSRARAQESILYLLLFSIIVVATILIMIPTAVMLGIQLLWSTSRLGEFRPLR